MTMFVVQRSLKEEERKSSPKTPVLLYIFLNDQALSYFKTSQSHMIPIDHCLLRLQAYLCFSRVSKSKLQRRAFSCQDVVLLGNLSLDSGDRNTLFFMIRLNTNF